MNDRFDEVVGGEEFGPTMTQGDASDYMLAYLREAFKAPHFAVFSEESPFNPDIKMNHVVARATIEAAPNMRFLTLPPRAQELWVKVNQAHAMHGMILALQQVLEELHKRHTELCPGPAGVRAWQDELDRITGEGQ